MVYENKNITVYSLVEVGWITEVCERETGRRVYVKFGGLTDEFAIQT